MREIKIRAWDSEGECFATGPQPDADDLFLENDTDESGKEHIYTITHWQRTIVNQWTGLKDKKGVEIYEGDIVEMFWSFTGASIFCTVIWVNEFARYAMEEIREDNKGLYHYFDSDNISRGIEVLGNIYKKPENLFARP